MTSLDQLFPAGPRDQAAAVLDDRHTAHQLDQLLGAPRRMQSEPVSADVPQLVAMVDAAARDARALPAVPGPTTVRRRRRSRDVLSLAAAAVAVVALVGAGTVGAVQAATSSPAEDAIAVLQDDEKTVANLEAAAQAQATELADAKKAAAADAAALRTALQGVREAPDPRADDDETTMPVVDASALDTLLKDLDAHVAAIDEVQVPELPAPYQRGEVDTTSLDSVGHAIDVVQQQLDGLDAAGTAMRASSSALDDLGTAFDAKLVTYAATFPKAAARAVERNPDAAEDLSTAMTAAGDRVASSQLNGKAGIDALAAYKTAYVALVEDQVREELRQAEEERRRQEEEERRRRNPPPSQTEPTPTPTDPQPTEPPSDSSAESDSPAEGDSQG